MLGDEGRALTVEGGIVGSPGREPVDVAVAEAEHGGDEDRVVNLEVGGAVLAGTRHVRRRDVLAACRGLPGDHEQRLQLVRDGGVLRVGLHAHDEIFVAVQMVGGNGAVDRLAVPAVVLRRHEGRDELALARRERVRPSQQHVDQLVQRLGRLRPEGHRAANSRKIGRQRDVWHGSSVAHVPARGQRLSLQAVILLDTRQVQ